jgi:hypothetical protein
VQPVWEGLAKHEWTVPQLEDIQRRFQSYDFIRDSTLPLQTERAVGVLTVDLGRREGFDVLDESGVRQPYIVTLLERAFFPSGWFCEEKLNECLLVDEFVNDFIDPKTRRITPARLAIGQRHLKEVRDNVVRSPLKEHSIIGSLLVPGLYRLPPKVVAAQTAVDEAALACALERYLLVRGRAPETLDSLSPTYLEHLPNDVIEGRPYKFRRTDDGKFVLYSVAWNEQDDQGLPEDQMFDNEKRDWVW